MNEQQEYCPDCRVSMRCPNPECRTRFETKRPNGKPLKVCYRCNTELLKPILIAKDKDVFEEKPSGSSLTNQP